MAQGGLKKIHKKAKMNRKPGRTKKGGGNGKGQRKKFSGGHHHAQVYRFKKVRSSAAAAARCCWAGAGGSGGSLGVSLTPCACAQNRSAQVRTTIEQEMAAQAMRANLPVHLIKCVQPLLLAAPSSSSRSTAAG